MAKGLKRVLSDNEDEPQQPMRKASRNIPDADEAPRSEVQSQIGRQNQQPLQDDEGYKNERPQRTTRGQGGRAEQLAKVGEQIRPDLRGKKSITTNLGENMPKAVKKNAMAPAAPKVRATKKKVPDVKSGAITPLQKEDPPLGSGAPQPTAQNVKATNLNMPFGFRAGPPTIPAPRRPAPTTHTPASRAQVPTHAPGTSAPSHIAKSAPLPPSESQQRTNYRSYIEKRKPNGDQDEDSRSPVPPLTAQISARSAPSKAHKTNRAHSEVIPDSEEEHKNFRGNPVQSRGDGSGGDGDNAGDSNHSDSGEGKERASSERQDDSAANSSTNEDGKYPAINNSEDLANEYDADLIDELSRDPGAGDEYDKNGNMDVDESPSKEEDEEEERVSEEEERSSEEEERIAEEKECIARGIQKRSARPLVFRSPVSYSVLASHHTTNRKIRAPNPADLNKSDQRPNSNSSKSKPQAASNHHNRSRSPLDDEADDENTDNESKPLVDHSKKRAKRNSKINTNKAPTRTQMGFYSPPWANLLEFSKNHYRLYLFTAEFGFYERTAAALRIAFNSVLEGIIVHENDPRSEPLDQYYFDKEALSILIFEDGASYRGKMKIMGREVLLSHYKDVVRPPPVKQNFKTEAERRKKIVLDVEAMLFEGTSFLRGGLDNNGRTKNFGHPVLADFCQQFFYSNKDTSLGLLFPAEFSELPRPCLSMACACLVNCVREYETGVMVSMKFDGKVFGPVQIAMLDLIDELDGDAYHGPRLGWLLEDIGWAGRVQSGKGSEKVHLGYRNVLD